MSDLKELLLSGLEGTTASRYAETLNALYNMQNSPAYAVRKQVLVDAEAAIVSLESQLAEAQAELKQLRYFHDKAQVLIDNQMWEIDRMRPVVEAAMAKRATLIGWVHDVGEAVRDYEAKEQK